MQGSKCNAYCINFLWEFFSFYEKVHSLLDPAVLLKKPFSPKNFLEVNKGIERLPQNVLNVFQVPTQSKSSDRVFFNRIDHQNYVLWTWYFLQQPEGQGLRTSLISKLGCYQNRNPSKTFLWGKFHLQKIQEIVPCGVTFNNKTGLKFTVQNSIELRLRRFDESVLKQLRQKLWKTVRKRM